MSSNNRQKGSKAEKLVFRFLAEQGWTPEEVNFTTPYGEVDLIFRKDGQYHFIEVKARTSQKFGTPAQAVTRTKQLRYLKSAQFFFSKRGIGDYRVCFDVAEVYLHPEGNADIRLIQNAYDFTGIEQFY